MKRRCGLWPKNVDHPSCTMRESQIARQLPRTRFPVTKGVSNTVKEQEQSRWDATTQLPANLSRLLPKVRFLDCLSTCARDLAGSDHRMCQHQDSNWDARGNGRT